MGHLVDGVDVAGGRGEGDGGVPGAGPLHRPGVGAAARQDFELMRNVLIFRDVAEGADELGWRGFGAEESSNLIAVPPPSLVT